MLKRLIEVALPLKEVSEQSAREKSIRHGHISTLHIWWARRPLAACRAVVFASLIPDPDDPECPEGFRKLVRELLGRGEFTPKNGEGATVEDTPRNRCLEFIKHLVRWENSNNPDYIEPARKLIAAAHKFLHPNSEGDAPKVLDPFAGGGAIPLEALRLGCEAHAIDINPVAHLIELCTLVYPQKHGQPDSRPVPDYIKRLIAHNQAKKKEKGEGRPLLKEEAAHGPVAPAAPDDEIVPDVEITEAEYRKNPLVADLKYWGHWVLTRAKVEIGHVYPHEPDGRVPVAYLWIRTVRSPDPGAGATIPLIRQLWLCQKGNRKVALRMTPNRAAGRCDFKVVEGKKLDFDPDEGTMKRGQAICPFTQSVATSKYLQTEGNAGRIGQQLVAVVTSQPGSNGKRYRDATDTDIAAYERATESLRRVLTQHGNDVLPREPLKPWSGVFNAPLFGLTTWGALFNERQALALVTLVMFVRQAIKRIAQACNNEYAVAVASYLALSVDRCAESNTNLGRWIPVGEKPAGPYGRQALAMVWDYCEVNLLEESPRQFADAIEWVSKCIEHFTLTSSIGGVVKRSSASGLPVDGASVDAVITDPPYYDAVPYSDLSDFFYVWLKRTIGDKHGDVFRTPLTPKNQEIVSHLGKNYPGNRKTAQDYETGMANALAESNRSLHQGGLAAVMFAHKQTSAWETLVASLVGSGFLVTASWPFHTERPGRLRAHESAALASSVTLFCRKRAEDAGGGLWDDVRQELREVARERLDFFWSQGIRGADFFISAIGPALSVFGKYERVTKLSGEEVTVGQFLDEVRGLVTNYALAKIMKTTQTASIDPESRFYVVWKWSYGDGKVPADESFKLAQALGTATETIWDRTGVLEKAGENVLAVPIAKRMKVKDLGDPKPDGTPASLIDVLHRLCVFREKNDTEGMGQFLARCGQGNNPALWIVAQAMSDILPDGDKEKQLMQGLLNQRDKLEEVGRQRQLL